MNKDYPLLPEETGFSIPRNPKALDQANFAQYAGDLRLVDGLLYWVIPLKLDFIPDIPQEIKIKSGTVGTARFTLLPIPKSMHHSIPRGFEDSNHRRHRHVA